MVKDEIHIPCNCDLCNNRKEPHYFPLENLKKFIEDKHSIQCLESYKMVDAWNLIKDFICIINVQKEHFNILPSNEFEKNANRELTLNINQSLLASQNQNQEQNQKSDLNIEIQTCACAITKAFKNLKEDMLDEIKDEDENKKLDKELGKVETAINKMQDLQTKDEARNSTALDRLKRFIDILSDTNTRVGKTVNAIENGIAYAKDLAKNYNKIAQLCDLSIIHDIFINTSASN